MARETSDNARELPRPGRSAADAPMPPCYRHPPCDVNAKLEGPAQFRPPTRAPRRDECGPGYDSSNSHRIRSTFGSRPTSRAAGKEGRLATDSPPRPPRGYAARVAEPECTDVLEDRKRRPDEPAAQPRGRRRALLAEAPRGRCGTLPGFCDISSAAGPIEELRRVLLLLASALPAPGRPPDCRAGWLGGTSR
jgi:hypothetical protein